MRELRLWHKHDGKDDDLGVAYDLDLPREGDVLLHPVRSGVAWKVLTVARTLVQPGSRRWREWQDGGRQSSPVDVFVVPADGPFEE